MEDIYMRKIVSLVLTVVFAVSFAGCDLGRSSETEPQLVHNRYHGETSTLRYVEDIDYTYIDYEEVAYQAGRLTVGPTEPWYVGVLTLSEDEAQRLWDEYEWEECEFPDIEMYDVDIEDPSDSTWYASEDFEQTIADKAVQVDTIVFNGSEIVFCLKTF